MKAVLNSIELTDLNRQDLSFAIPSFAPHLGLCDSLRCCGILQPPWIRAKADGTKIIVDGFKRLEWAFQESFERIRVLLFAAECDPVKLLLDRIEAKLFGPALNVAEKAQIVSKLVQNVAPEVMQSRYLPRLGIAAHPEAIRKWCRLAASDEHLLAAAALEEISDRTALELVDWEKEAQREIISLLKELRCSFSIQSEILERVREIALREESSELQVLNVPELAAIKDDKNRNHREKTQALRDWLYRRRYPRIKAREERFMRDLAASDLPARVRITPPPAFEGQNWQLQLFFGNPGELVQMLGDLQVFAGSAEL
ncbi:MAG: hypothetical protein RBS57_17890, partial [Desulforhabdus sp.]|nr:hypothetical protein [Desulforhabdus sp.]